MTAKWSSNSFAGNPGAAGGVSSAIPGFEDKEVVLLLFGKNSFGDKIYSYLKITLSALQNLKAAVQAGNGFNPSDFGTVVAAGKGEPTDAVRAEVAATYQVVDARKTVTPSTQADIPAEKKAWDEY